MLTNAFWILSYVSGLLFFLTSVAFSWTLFKNILIKFNHRKTLFALGLVIISGTYLFVDMSNVNLYPTWVIVAVASGFILLTTALSKEWWQYLLPASLLTPYLFTSDTHIVYYLSLIAGLLLAYYAYKNMFCGVLDKCSYEADEVVDWDRLEWAIAFIALAIASFGYTLLTIQNPSAPLLIYQGIIIVAKVVSSLVIIHYLIHFNEFKRNELIAMPLLACFIAVLVTVNVLFSFWVKNTLMDQLGEVANSNIHASYEIANLTYPNGQLAKLIETRDGKLEDLVDSIEAKTKIRTTFFLGDIRIAANPSLSTNMRPIGVKLTSEDVRKTVLENGKEYVGKVYQNGKILIASYLPIYDNGKIIGMVGTAQQINNITSIESKLLKFYVLVGIFVAVVLIGVLTVAKLVPRSLK